MRKCSSISSFLIIWVSVSGNSLLDPCFYSCQDGQFQCSSGHCIQEHFRCDGERNCHDLSDELDCPPRYPGNRYCREEKFQCDNHLCVEMRDLCDGSNDCYDNSDERESLCSEYCVMNFCYDSLVPEKFCLEIISKLLCSQDTNLVHFINRICQLFLT